MMKLLEAFGAIAGTIVILTMMASLAIGVITLAVWALLVRAAKKALFGKN